MAPITTDRKELIISAPELRGAIMRLRDYDEAMVGVDGPAGTGKTFGILYFFHSLLLNYPGSKILVARKSNTDLAGSAMATFQDYILHPAEGIHYFGGNKVEPAAYRYPNGSKMVVNGLDKPSKVKSMEFDGVYINEATECDLEDIDFCWGRLGRRGKLPLQPFVMDFNPDAPYHWLNLHMNEGKIVRLTSRHEDNPYMFNARTGEWTEAGVKYLARLDKLTGVRLLRLRYGQWCAAEGMVYQDSWDRSRNLINKFAIPREWPRYLAVDFGFTNPFVAQWWAEDPDGRLYRYREIYRTKTLVEDHARKIKELSRWGAQDGEPLPYAIICDHDAEDRATLERHLGLSTTPAHKDVSPGIQAIASRLKLAGDGKARLFFLRDSLVERDHDLTDRKKPTCTEEEMESYIWDANKEKPIKDDDHGMDTTRYMGAHRDLQPSGMISFVPGIQRG
jgi:phage terminase large subunit